jgi:membrane protease YdiL (CAAX protease family)
MGMMKEFENRNRDFHPIFCDLPEPFRIAAMFFGSYHLLFFAHSLALHRILSDKPALAGSYLNAASSAEILILTAGLVGLWYFWKSEFINRAFFPNLGGSIITGLIFSAFFIFIIMIILVKPDFREFLLDYYVKNLLASIGDTSIPSRCKFGVLIFLSSIYEEMVFRAILLKYFSMKMGQWGANILITLLFVTLHFIYNDITLPAVAGWTSLSLICGIALFKTNGWVAPAIIHVVYNSRFFIFAPLFI